MTIVGMYPLKRRTIRGAINPLDKSTVVSIYPVELDEKKCTIQPGRFIVPPGRYDNPSILVVGPSSWWREIDDEQPLLEIPVSSIQVADSIVRDYCVGILGCDMSTNMPGLFYIPGEQTVDSIKKNFKSKLDEANVKQKNWYNHLIKMASSLWARSNGNPLAVSEAMRMAARELGQTSHDWMKDFQMVDMVRCIACGSLKNPQYPICASCHFPDPSHPMTAKLLEIKTQMPIQK